MSISFPNPKPTRQRQPRQRLRVVSIPSSSDPNVSYTVVIHENGMTTCNCPAGIHHRPCRHQAVMS